MVVGASYTDVHVELPILWLLIGLSIVAAFAAWANLWVHTYRLPMAAAVLVFGGSLLLSGVVPGLFQHLFVKPNELQREKPYIERNIALTQQAYNLHQIATKPFPAEQDLTFKTLEADKATIDNIRLWDWQPLMDTYAQLQEIRTYYKFHDLDVDRYRLDGAYQSVMLSARELKSSLLPPNAQTWVNRHVLFTHGNGVVMSPVTRKSAEGLPLFYLRDIPPVATGGPEIREPRIYYGEETDSYVIVKGSTPEFDYPKGKDNIYAAYDGTGGVPVGGIARRILFAWYFYDVNILLSSYITGDSRIMIRRNIQERVRTIAPFLRLDHDPYLVISDGRLFWMQDAYTTSNYFPYAQPVQDLDLNYIRNSVKVVVDAYNGTVDFYLMDPADPIAATYQRIFPGLFKPFAAMPPGLQKHIRYPEDLFLIQARLYQAYHMEAADVFYNREDLWQFPRQPGGAGTAVMAPYYIIMRLPGEPQAEFFLMLPMVPSRRDNMKKADCGIAVSSATDAARAAAAIVLMTLGLSVIIDAIKESRKIFQRMNSYAMYRIAETLRVLLFMTLAILVFNFYPLTAVMIVMLALLNDGAILSIAYDNVHYKDAPEAWNMRLVLGIATVLGLVGPIAAFGLFFLGDRVFHLDHPHLQTMMYLMLSVAGHLTIFQTRTRGPFWSIRPARILWMAVLGTQTVATLIAVYGLFMTPLGWVWAMFVWGYALAWFLVTDPVKLLAYRILDPVKAAAQPEAKAGPQPEAKAEPKPEAKAEPKPSQGRGQPKQSRAKPKPTARSQS